MDDLAYGTRNKRGDWAPKAHAEIAPFWAWPPQLTKILSWLPGYFWPWNAFHMATTLAYWYWVIPSTETMKTLGWGWALWLYAVNAACIFVMYGAIEFFYYVKRKQGTRFKYNANFPADKPSDVFWFKSQNIDNFLRTYLFGIPMWTLVEVLMLWIFANGWVPWLSWSNNPVYLCFLVLMCPVIHEVNFFIIHRMIHIPIPLQVGPLGASQFDQSLALVVALDASGRDVPLSRGGVLAHRSSVQSHRRAVPAAYGGFWRYQWPYRLR